MFDCLEDIIASAADTLRPAERLTVAQAAEKYRLVTTGLHKGMWKNSTTPYLVEAMEVLTSEEYTAMVFCGSAQCGKTNLVLNWILHTAFCDPSDITLLGPAQHFIRDFSIRNIQKLIRDHPEFKKLLITGRQNQNLFDLKFKSGHLLTLQWPTMNALAGKSIRYMFLTDYDRRDKDDVEGEGSLFALAQKRTNAYYDLGMTVAESSPGFPVTDPAWVPKSKHQAPPTDGVLKLYNQSDRRRWYWKCVDCNEAWEPDYTHFKFPDSADPAEAAAQVYMACPHCGSVYHERARDGKPGKNEMNNEHARWIKDGQLWLPDGTIAGTAVQSKTAGFWLKGVVALGSWEQLVFSWLSAEKAFEESNIETDLMTVMNTGFGHPYIPRAQLLARLPEELKSRAKPLNEKTVPLGTRFLIATVDVQKNRFVVQVHGFGVNGDEWIVDRFDIRKSNRVDDDGDRAWVKPQAYLEDWQLLVPEVLEKTYPLDDESGRVMRIKAVGCDSGGSGHRSASGDQVEETVTSNAYKFYRWLRDEHGGNLHQRFQLIKTSSQKTAPRIEMRFPDSERKDRFANARGEIPVLFLNPVLVKDQVSNKLDRQDPGGGMVTFPNWLPVWFYEELCAETRTVRGWENIRRARNESFDLMVYAEAMAISKHARIEQINWDDPPSFAADWDDNDLVVDPAAKPHYMKPKDDFDFESLGADLA